MPRGGLARRAELVLCWFGDPSERLRGCGGGHPYDDGSFEACLRRGAGRWVPERDAMV
ncbi:hypothetical protein RSSM_05078 [Rhodopirellula sallentina SM41]|uniref:Uncharacterized protein n=1 Tax=Rhodopirellula sallentina SM41 TaxID=1263870 RepID=M5TW75_9BACT|nr:hypothetical protein RSSM_05078 [Rhodopirellula sallentina SM41]